MKSGALQRNVSFWKTFWLTFAILFFFLGIAEWMSRLDVFQRYLTPPRLGSRHSQLGYKLSLLNAEVKKTDPWIASSWGVPRWMWDLTLKCFKSLSRMSPGARFAERIFSAGCI